MEDEIETKIENEEMMSRAMRVAFHAEGENFKKYCDVFTDLKKDLRIKRLKDSGHKFSGKLKKKVK